MNIAIIKSKSYSYIITGSNGLIGSSITNSLVAEIPKNEITVRYIRAISYNEINQVLKRICSNLSSDKCLVSTIIFAHGAGGFSITQAEAESQCIQFYQMLSMLENTNTNYTSIVLLSSLGAYLSRLESHYKFLIEKKESIASQSKIRCSIIRLPSIWGFRGREKTPKGLIANLIACSVLMKESLIYGSLNTTRNYLYVESIGWEITKIVLSSFKNDNMKKIYNIRSVYFYDITGIISTIKQSLPYCRLVYKIENENVLHSENHTSIPLDGVDWTVKSCLSVEIKRAWRLLIDKPSL